MKANDLVFYLVGSGEYDELMRAFFVQAVSGVQSILALLCIGRHFAAGDFECHCQDGISRVRFCAGGRARALWVVGAVREALGAVIAVLGETLGRIPNEASFFRDYGKAVLALDEAICEVRVLDVKQRYVPTALSGTDPLLV